MSNLSSSFIFPNILIDVNDYEFIRLIGSGGCGAVYRVKEKKSGNIYALKVIFKCDSDLEDKAKQQTILREAFVPCSLNSQGIVPLIGFRFPLTQEEIEKNPPFKVNVPCAPGVKKPRENVDFDGAIYVTELMKNGSLDKITKMYLEKKGKVANMNPTVRSKIVFGVASTMKRVHRFDVIHRDLKLQNIFLDDNFEPRIADFGLSKFVSPGVQMTLNIGTPISTAPEIYNDNYDISVDVYSYAFVLFCLFSNKIEFQKDVPIRTPQQYIMKTMSGERPMRQDSIPDHYWDLICKCWNHSPAKRPSFEQIVEILKDDKYAIEEFGMKTDLEELHRYQKQIEEYNDGNITISDIHTSTVFDGSDTVKIADSTLSYTEDIRETQDEERKEVFNWKRH